MSRDRTLPKQIIRKEEIPNATDSENADYKGHFGLCIACRHVLKQLMQKFSQISMTENILLTLLLVLWPALIELYSAPPSCKKN